MIVPKFSIRQMLIAMTALAALSLLVSYAIQGHSWAIAVAVALGSAALIFLVHGVTFILSSPTILIDAMLRSRQTPTTPFATTEPPAQILPPEDPE